MHVAEAGVSFLHLQLEQSSGSPTAGLAANPCVRLHLVNTLITPPPYLMYRGSIICLSCPKLARASGCLKHDSHRAIP